MRIKLGLPLGSHRTQHASYGIREERLGNIFGEPRKTGSHPGLNRGPLTSAVSALPPELWPPGDSQPSQFSISLCICRQNPARDRAALLAAAKRQVKSDDVTTRLAELACLEKQGHMLGAAPTDAATIWSKAVQALPQNTLKFALSASLDTLLHNNNLHLWKKCSSSMCQLCHEPNQSLLHVLNNCSMGLQLCRYNERHDEVIKVIANSIQNILPSTTKLTTDLGGEYHFPSHVASTDLRPDIVWWDDTSRTITLIELTVCLESCFDDAKQRKEDRYADLLHALRRAQYKACLVMQEVGSRGLLKEQLHLDTKTFQSMLIQISSVAGAASFKVWCTRNRTFSPS